MGSLQPIKRALSLGICSALYIWIQIFCSFLLLDNAEDYISPLLYNYTQNSYFALICPFSCTRFSLALWIAKAKLWGKASVEAHLCFHRNCNMFQCTCLWYLKRKGERLFQFAWQNSLMWAICYINRWTLIIEIINICPGLVVFLAEEHDIPNSFIAVRFFQVISILGRCQTAGHVLFLRVNMLQFCGRCGHLGPMHPSSIQPCPGMQELAHGRLWELGVRVCGCKMETGQEG